MTDQKTKLPQKYYIISLVALVFSIICGILSHDYIIGSAVLFSGLLCGYFSSEGKRSNYLFGLINYLLMGYVAFKNQLFGIFFFYLFIFSPLQVNGFMSWKKHLQQDQTVKVREFTLVNSIIITLSCVVGSALIGLLLTLIPGQRLAFIDAASNCVNLCAVILMILRFKEAWWLYLVNNLIDLVIWIITTIQGGDGAVMMLLVSIGYLIINLYGIFKWTIWAKHRIQREQQLAKD